MVLAVPSDPVAFFGLGSASFVFTNPPPGPLGTTRLGAAAAAVEAVDASAAGVALPVGTLEAQKV